MPLTLHTLPVSSRDIRFEQAGKKRLLFLVPEKSRSDSVDFRIFGKPLPLDIGLQTNADLADFEPAPDPTGKIQTDALTIDFHQPRTIRTINADITTSAAVSELACILRVWGGNQWYLPLPVNLLKFNQKQSGTAGISKKLPAVKAEKLLLHFVRLKNIQAGSYLNLSAYPVDDLMEIMNFEATKAVEEGASVTVNSLTLGTEDSISSLTMGLEGKPPLFITPGDFTASEEKPQQIPDPAGALQKAVEETASLEISEIEISESLQAELPIGKKYHPLPLMVSSAASGIMTVQTLSPKFLFFEKKLASDENKPHQEVQSLRFLPDTKRKFIPRQSLFAAIPHPSRVKKIGFSIEGSLLNEVRIPQEFLWPQPLGENDNLGIQASEGEKIFSFFKTDTEPLSLKAVEIPGSSMADKLDLTLSVLNDIDGMPDLEANPLSIGTVTYEKSRDDLLVSAENQWLRFDFSDPFPVIQKNVSCWLCLETAGGEFTWQAETAASDPAVFTYRMPESGALTPCGPHLDKPVILTARFLYRPDRLDNHLNVNINNLEIGNIRLKDLNRIEANFDQNVDIEHSQGLFQIDFISKSEGNIEISNIKIAYEDDNNPIYLVLEE